MEKPALPPANVMQHEAAYDNLDLGCICWVHSSYEFNSLVFREVQQWHAKQAFRELEAEKYVISSTLSQAISFSHTVVLIGHTFLRGLPQ
jgi:hypothetical protein